MQRRLLMLNGMSLLVVIAALVLGTELLACRIWTTKDTRASVT